MRSLSRNYYLKKINIFWFRRDLRLYDNHALHLALQDSLPVLAIFIFDPEILNPLEDKEDSRVQFIYDRLQEISQNLEKNKGTLLIFQGDVCSVWQDLVRNYSIQKVFANHDYEPYPMARDLKVNNLLKERGIDFITCKDQVIFEKGDILKPDGSPYIKYTPFAKKWRAKLNKSDWQGYDCQPLSGRFLQIHGFSSPLLHEIGFKPGKFPIPSEIIDKGKISHYHLYRDIPSQEGTTLLGVHLRFGTISIRELVKVALEENEIFLSELIWREFFMQILYHFPKVVNHSFCKERDSIKWSQDSEHWDRWCKGNTGYPLVDAGMRQINKTGYMHNRVRMIVASFLTKHLLIDWRWGEAYFAKKLLDYELSSNNGNWQWAASTGCDSVPYFRIFNPILQQKRFDPQNSYIQTWVKEWGTPLYPKPVVDNKTARSLAMKAYRS